MKFLSVALFLAAFAVGAYSLNATYGTIYSNSPLLSRELVLNYPVNGQSISRNVDYPKSGQTNTRVITGIRVVDNFKNTTGANPTLWSGGPGYTFTTLNLKSQLGRGINSTVEIYGN